MSISKRYLKTKPICKVTFKLPKDTANDARSVHFVSEVNNWDEQSVPMRRLKSGDFTLTLDLEVGREYQFRYLIDHTQWENDQAADKYVPTPYGDSHNSVVTV